MKGEGLEAEKTIITEISTAIEMTDMTDIIEIITEDKTRKLQLKI